MRLICFYQECVITNVNLFTIDTSFLIFHGKKSRDKPFDTLAMSKIQLFLKAFCNCILKTNKKRSNKSFLTAIFALYL